MGCGHIDKVCDITDVYENNWIKSWNSHGNGIKNTAGNSENNIP